LEGLVLSVPDNAIFQGGQLYLNKRLRKI
jgi:hypothetical protein